MTEIGEAALWLGLFTALYAAVTAFSGARKTEDPKGERLLASARNGVFVLAGLLTLAVSLLTLAFLTHDFSIAYVARNHSRSTPPLYTLTGLWGGQAGSLLVWTWLLSLYSAAFTLRRDGKDRQLVYPAIGVLMGMSVFFLLILISVENPFARLPNPPADGRGLNPLLEDPGMLIHPPLLYLGYIGFAVPYAIGMAALMATRTDPQWIRVARPWAMVAWISLGTGMVAGGWWAYRTLGWGGYWGWDPVENSALMPWLVGTAYLHSAMVQERRGMLAAWNVALIILTFSLAILGTFLTRTGIVLSVHSFAQSAIGPYFVSFLGILFVGSFGLFLWRLEDLRSHAELESLASRECAFLLNNVLFLGMAFAVLLGTLFPILSEALQGSRISVGAPYYIQVIAPFGLLLILLMGFGHVLAWRRTPFQDLLVKLRWPVAAGFVALIALFVLLRRPLVVLALAMVSFALGTVVQEYHGAASRRSRVTGESYLPALWRAVLRHRRRYGGYLVHTAFLLIVVGIIGSHAYVTERQATLSPAGSLQVGRYTLIYRAMEQARTDTSEGVAAVVEVQGDGGNFLMRPKRMFYPSFQQFLSKPAVHSSWREDLYVVLENVSQEGKATFRIWINPLVRWIWLGGLIFLFGSGFAAWPEARSMEKRWEGDTIQPSAATD
ncbi:MAG: heme lyase CcmF/NrfE family subunit [Armatimonadota bacterium]|nr:heme lyase CcmF/NrfE family subunit [Armatimonadota bacterium]MDR5704178.1 heme lyase CcmF/NrfE family subunit [Armatimonadota bacterium]